MGTSKICWKLPASSLNVSKTCPSLINPPSPPSPSIIKYQKNPTQRERGRKSSFALKESAPSGQTAAENPGGIFQQTSTLGDHQPVAHFLWEESETILPTFPTRLRLQMDSHGQQMAMEWEPKQHATIGDPISLLRVALFPCPLFWFSFNYSHISYSLSLSLFLIIHSLC